MTRVALVFLATGECDEVTGLQLHDVFAQRADAKLGPGQVLQDRHGPPCASCGVAHASHRLLVLGQCAVRVVQACDIHTGAHHREQGVGLTRGGPDGGDDLCAAHRLRKVAVVAATRVGSS